MKRSRRSPSSRDDAGPRLGPSPSSNGRRVRLTPAAELECLHRWQVDGDAAAREELVYDQQPLVTAIARSYWRSWVLLEDLVQEGNLGLLKAIDRFDRTRGVRLATYARPWIRSAILHFLLDNARLVRLGRSRGERRIFFGLNGAEQALAVRGLEASAAALAEQIGTDAGEVESLAWRLDHPDQSIDGANGDLPFALKTNGVESTAANNELCDAVRRLAENLLPELAERDAEILRARVLLQPDPSTLRELGTRFGVSRERIRQIEEDCLERLRAFVRARVPDAELWSSAPEGEVG